jgi:glycosyltransferase involved in cell wall biosynthesis
VSCLKRARRIFADSHSTARDLQAELNIEPARIVVNHLGVDESFHPISQDGLRSSAAVGLGGLLASHRLILHVGSNVVQKNMPTLLRALRELLRQGVPVKLVKVGDRLLAGRMASLARELGVEGAIMDLGSLPRADLVEVYNACDVLVFPSLCEGFGLPVLEAQACGLPCVLADASSLPEVGGDAALYHPANDAAELARQVLRILNEPGMRPDLVKRGKENASRFTWDRHVERLVEEYRGVAHEWRGRTQVAQRASRR